MAERVPPILLESREPLEYYVRDWTSTGIVNSTSNDRTDKSSALLLAMRGWINTGHGWLYSLAFRHRVPRVGHERHSCHHDSGGESPPQQRRTEYLERYQHHRHHHYHELQKHERERTDFATCSSTTTCTTNSTTTTPTSSTMFPPLVFLVLFASTVFRIAEACSSRSTPKPRPPSPTLRPNITFQTYDCPEAYAKWYCLNGATCFSVRIGESILYNCECADGYMGQRCEFKDLDGSYLPSREQVMIETASIAGGVTILVFLIVILSVFACIYFRRKEKLKRMPSDVSQSELDRKPFNTRISSKNPVHLVNTRDPELGRGLTFMPLMSSNSHEATSELMRNNNRNGNGANT